MWIFASEENWSLFYLFTYLLLYCIKTFSELIVSFLPVFISFFDMQSVAKILLYSSKITSYTSMYLFKHCFNLYWLKFEYGSFLHVSTHFSKRSVILPSVAFWLLIFLAQIWICCLLSLLSSAEPILNYWYWIIKFELLKLW